jgi:hypothetical protein
LFSLDQMLTRLRPSFLRTWATFVIPVATLLVLAHLFHPRKDDLQISGVAVFLGFWSLLPGIVWLFCVPRHLEFSEAELTIKPALGRLQTLDWTDLEYFGPANGVFLLQFYGRSPFMVFTLAFPRADWLQLKRFLYSQFPERVASGHIAGYLFKWRR